LGILCLSLLSLYFSLSLLGCNFTLGLLESCLAFTIGLSFVENTVSLLDVKLIVRGGVALEFTGLQFAEMWNVL
jgi:hypothetical protein